MKMDWTQLALGAVAGVVLYSLYSNMASAAPAGGQGAPQGGYGPGGGYVPPGGGGYGAQAYTTTGTGPGY